MTRFSDISNYSFSLQRAKIGENCRKNEDLRKLISSVLENTLIIHPNLDFFHRFGESISYSASKSYHFCEIWSKYRL